MRYRKYSIILIALLLLFFLGQFVSAVVERGLPTQPVYYISSVIEIGLGFLTYKFQWLKIAKRLPILVLVFMLLCIGIPIAFYYSGIASLRPVGGAQMWYILSLLVLELYRYIKTRSGTELTRADENTEYMSKGLVFLILIITILMAIAFAVIYLLVTLS